MNLVFPKLFSPYLFHTQVCGQHIVPMPSFLRGWPTHSWITPGLGLFPLMIPTKAVHVESGDPKVNLVKRVGFTTSPDSRRFQCDGSLLWHWCHYAVVFLNHLTLALFTVRLFGGQ
eukprot:Protomagalhaensia_sp_Gyna_25__5148@NODE_603_length_3032_cov_18_391246_g466_i0_p3_GENE_NODE_603_length_3032_cov_18_391246_g466_i0NODE_603_length_3032_cov_18_391246_g466_i0_p3_ORF_typecomplete_len116_score6_62_NODE_603_length_3032_cov_18_391246_g466_i013911738